MTTQHPTIRLVASSTSFTSRSNSRTEPNTSRPSLTASPVMRLIPLLDQLYRTDPSAFHVAQRFIAESLGVEASDEAAGPHDVTTARAGGPDAPIPWGWRSRH